MLSPRRADQSQFTKLFTEKAVGFIEANKARPFFLYVPHYAPHAPIQGKPEVIANLRGGAEDEAEEE